MVQESYQWWSIVLQASLLFVNFCVGVVIWWYTVETKKLRLEAQKQNDLSMMPLVTLEGARDLPLNEGGGMEVYKIVLRNLGSGAAFNITVDPLEGSETKVELEQIMSLAPGHREPVWIRIREEGRQTESPAYQSIQRMFHNHQLVSGHESTIRYMDADGNSYRTILTYEYDWFTREVRPKFAKRIPEALS